jgi:hypothetical protein
MHNHPLVRTAHPTSAVASPITRRVTRGRPGRTHHPIVELHP